MRPSVPTWSAAAVRRTLVLGVIALDVVAFLVVGVALRRSWTQHRERAVVQTQNLSASLEQYLGGLLDRIDVGLLAVVDEREHALAASGAIEGRAFDAFLARQRRRFAELDAIRTVDAAGYVDHGDGIQPNTRTYVGDRGYFIRLRDEPGARLVISEPVTGRINGIEEIIVARRLRGTDGSFAGAAAATISLDAIDRAFASFDVGRRGVIVLRDDRLGLVVRRQSEGVRPALGDRTVSPELHALLREGRTQATYTGMPVDGIERTFTFRKVSQYPLYVIVGLEFGEFLGEWWGDALVALAFLATFVILTGLAAWFGYRSWRRRELAVEALAKEETKFRLVAESASDLIWMIDAEQRVTYMSPAVEPLLGYTTEEVMALPRGALFTPAYQATIDRLAAKAFTVPSFTQPFAGVLLAQELLCKNGQLLHAEAHFNLLWSADGRLVGALGISRDVTERKDMQARVQVAERMASLGTLAAGVAHEVNNPLTYVLSNVGYALEQLRATEADWSTRPGCEPLHEAEEALSEALDGADRVRHIVSDLKTLSRAEGDRQVDVEVNPVVERCLKMIANVTSARGRVVRRLGEVPRVRASESRLAQVILNLLVNAAHAIPEGRACDAEIFVTTSVAADGRVELAVGDTGQGISADVLPRIFDPFFTTKPVGEGTGLGLSISHGIVRALGGEIRVETEVGRGSVFRVLLPPAPPGAGSRPAARAAEARRAEAPRVRRRVLVLDDDPLVARAVARLIAEPCAVEVLTDAAQALARIAAGERWDVILCDLMMPEVSGMDLHAHVEAVDAGLAARMVFMTGGAFTPRAEEFLARVPNARLEKPIDRGALARALCGLAIPEAPGAASGARARG